MPSGQPHERTTQKRDVTSKPEPAQNLTPDTDMHQRLLTKPADKTSSSGFFAGFLERATSMAFGPGENSADVRPPRERIRHAEQLATTAEEAAEHLQGMLEFHDLSQSVLSANPRPSYSDLHDAYSLGDEIQHERKKYQNIERKDVQSIFSSMESNIALAENNLKGVKPDGDHQDQFTSTSKKVRDVKSQVEMVIPHKKELRTFDFDQHYGNVRRLVAQRVVDSIKTPDEEQISKIASLEENAKEFEKMVKEAQKIQDELSDNVFHSSQNRQEMQEDASTRITNFMERMNKVGMSCKESREIEFEVRTVLDLYTGRNGKGIDDVKGNYQGYLERIAPIVEYLRENGDKWEKIRVGLKKLYTSIHDKNNGKNAQQQDLLQ